MIKAFVINLKGSWDAYLSLIKLVYNNSYQASIQMAPYKALYDRRCRSLLCWEEVGERKILGPELVQVTTEKIWLICDRLLMVHSG